MQTVIHMHTRTHACTHTHMQAHACMHLHARSHTHTHTHTNKTVKYATVHRYDVSEKLTKQLGESAPHRYSFVCNCMLEITQSSNTERSVPLSLAERSVPLSLAERSVPLSLAERSVPLSLAERSVPLSLVEWCALSVSC